MIRCAALLISLVLIMICTTVAYGQESECTLEEIRQPGDANQDLVFDQLDLVQVQAAGKFLTGRPASWAEGDFNGDGVFDRLDVIAAQQTGNYLQGPYAVAVTGPPPSRRGGAPAVWFTGPRSWLPGASSLVFFGGMNPITADTFRFGPKDGWQEITNDSAPAKRCHHTLVSDGAGAIMFGGFTIVGGREGRFNDTWRFDPATERWTEIPTAGDIPQARCLHASAWIPSTNEMLMYSGISGSGRFANDFFHDTSVLDLNENRWRRLDDRSPPGPRSDALAVYSSAEDAVFLWGGLQITTRMIAYPNDLWRYDPKQRSWETVAVTGDIPAGREAPTYFWDDANSRLYVFHGHNQFISGSLFDDAHVLHLSERRWEQLAATGTKPAPRWRASVAYDPQTSAGWVFGGWVDFGNVTFNDTWKFDTDSRSWTKICILQAEEEEQDNPESP